MSGYIRFSPIFKYREYEQNAYESGIADPFDGMSKIVTEHATYITKDGEERQINGKISINIDLEGMKKLGVFCLAQYESIEDMDQHYRIMLEKFPDTTHILVIRTPHTFAKDIQSVLPTVAGGTVRYGEKMNPPLNYEDMWLQALYKRQAYSYQREFRFVITGYQLEDSVSYKYDNRSEMTLLSVYEIESFIENNKGIDIEVHNSNDVILEKDNSPKDSNWEIEKIMLKQL